MRNFLVITVVGLGTFYGYRGYSRYRWFNEMSDSDKTIGTKPRIVVLGTGKELIQRCLFIRIILFRLGCGTTFKTY